MEDKSVHQKLDDHVIHYFVRVQESIQDDFVEDPESKQLFMKNVLNEIENDFVRLAKNWKVSRILEDLVPKFSDEGHIETLFKTACLSAPLIISNQFGSHVLQKILRTLPKQRMLISLEEEGSVAKVFLSMIETYLLDSLPTLMRDTYASHVLSEVIQLLGMVKIDQKVSRSRTSMKYQKRHKIGEHYAAGVADIEDVKELPEEFESLLGQTFQSIMDCSNFGELLCNQSANQVLQTSLLVSQKRLPKHCKILTMKILKKGNLVIEDPNSPTLASSTLLLLDAVGSHLVEKLLLVMSQKRIKQLYRDCLQDNLASLSLHHIGNFSVQTFLKVCQSKEIVEEAVQILCKNMAEIFQSGYTQVIVQMANVAATFKVSQSAFLSSLLSSKFLQCEEDCQVNIARRLLCLSKAFEKEEKSLDQELKVKNLCYHGCTLVSHVLRFKKNKKVVGDLLDMTEKELLALSCHPHGSIVMESLCQTEHVKSKMKDKLHSFFMSNLRLLSTDKFGSRVIDKFWSKLPLLTRGELMKELLRHEAELRKSFFGKFVLQNCETSLYKESEKAWRRKQAELLSNEVQDRESNVAPLADTLCSPSTQGAEHDTTMEPESPKRKRTSEKKHSGNKKRKKN